ncbi:polysaccharide biosynthesis protein [Pedobacter boryungensis]|uniref:Polysaccharide biosynthesis protein n=1 Tax=Pedobacter boryungensis TaxID=869962 RepID=A0ABX2DG20_9SPHI|nr:nucleoside-diphosphate sugar epimerase/dehydratase [Pedobacter boryungensis]NQX32722.1 polysaccharide biosynthesis protein [Pedobacter boryungensis]
MFKLEIVSRWVIFAIDFFLCLIALLLAKIVRHNFIFQEIDILALYKSILIYSVVNVIVFSSVRTFTGIVRYTSIQDSFRIFFAVLFSSFLIFLVHSIFVLYGWKNFIINTTIIIQALFSFLFLIIYRVLIKYFFMYLKNAKLNKTRVLIYGAGEAGVATKRTFDHDVKLNKNIIGFIDDDLRKVGKTIDGIQIMDASKLAYLITNHEVDELIFTVHSISPEQKDKVIDICLTHKVNILNIPLPEIWEKGELTLAQLQQVQIEDLLEQTTIEVNANAINDQIKGKRIVITGAAGSIGSELVRQLLKFEPDLLILCDQNETALHHIYLELEELSTSRSFHAFIGDIKDAARMEQLFDTYKPHIIYHIAGYKHISLMEDNASEAIKTNVLGTKILADKAVKHGVQRFIMISTDKAVNPTNIMGASKRIAELYVQSLNSSLHSVNHIFSNGLSFINELKVRPITKFTTIRFGNVLGSNGSIIPRFKEQIERGGPVTITHPEMTRHFIPNHEACKLILEAGTIGAGGEVFIFDMGKSVKILDLAKKMIRIAGFVPDQDIKMHYSGLRPGEKLYEELFPNSESTLPTTHNKIRVLNSKPMVFNEIEQQVYELLIHATANNNIQLGLQMKKMVPEFKRINVVYEKL